MLTSYTPSDADIHNSPLAAVDTSVITSVITSAATRRLTEEQETLTASFCDVIVVTAAGTDQRLIKAALTYEKDEPC